jgi:hypothetical protein
VNYPLSDREKAAQTHRSHRAAFLEIVARYVAEAYYEAEQRFRPYSRKPQLQTMDDVVKAEEHFRGSGYREFATLLRSWRIETQRKRLDHWIRVDKECEAEEKERREREGRVGLAVVQERRRCPKRNPHGAHCLRLARHQSACRFSDETAEVLWQAVADLMALLPIHIGGPGERLLFKDRTWIPLVDPRKEGEGANGA